MRAKVTVLVVWAIVFAPGWGGLETDAASRTPPELAARMLAPTFDEATERANGSFEQRRGSLEPAGASHELGTLPAASPATKPPIELVVAAITALALRGSRERSRFRAQRGPPRLLTV